MNENSSQIGMFAGCFDITEWFVYSIQLITENTHRGEALKD